MKDSRLLPIGSVVLLKNAVHRIMITGFLPITDNEDGKVYDYWGCLYPEGLMSPDKYLVFNHKDINKVFATGYSDKEEEMFRGQVINFIPQIKDDDGNAKMTPAEFANIIKNGGKK